MVVLNSPERLPIGAIMDEPAAPALPQFSMARQPDGSVQFEWVTAAGAAIKKRFPVSADLRKRTTTSSRWTLISGTTARRPTKISATSSPWARPCQFIRRSPELHARRLVHRRQDQEHRCQLVLGPELPADRRRETSRATHLPGKTKRRGMGRDQQPILHLHHHAFEFQRDGNVGPPLPK